MTMIPYGGLMMGRWKELLDNSASVILPKADVKETDDAFMVEVDLPGVKKEDIEIVCEKGMLTITAKRQAGQEDNVRVLRKERFEGDIARRFVIRDIEEENIAAKFENGVVIVTLPKKASNEKRIAID